MNLFEDVLISLGMSIPMAGINLKIPCNNFLRKYDMNWYAVRRMTIKLMVVKK